MDNIRLLLGFWLVCFVAAASLKDVLENLQSVEEMLTNLEDKNMGGNTMDMTVVKTELHDYVNDQKTELKQYIDDQKIELKRYMDDQMKITTDILHTHGVVLRSFMTEKRLRKQLEGKVTALQMELGKMDRYATKQSVETVKSETARLHSKVDEIVDDINKRMDVTFDTCDKRVENVRGTLTGSLAKTRSELVGKIEVVNTGLTASMASYSSLDEKISDADARLTSFLAVKPQRVAFSARIDWNKYYKNIGAGETVVFSSVSLNIGNGYSGITGKFTVPIDGVYVFHAHIAGGDNRAMHMALYKNNVAVLILYVNGPKHGTDGSAIAMKLNLGDVVTVRRYGTFGQPPFHVNHVVSTFTGFLLYEN